MIDRVKKLFALGTSPNQNEAKAALATAQRLLEQHGLHEGDLQAAEPDDYGVAHVGDIVLRAKPEDFRSVLSQILAAHFRVRCIWVQALDDQGRTGLQLELCGRRCDLAVAEYVHGFLFAEALRLWERQSGEARARLDFLEGVMRGHLETLNAEARARAAETGGHAQPALVHLAHMKAGLDDYFARRYPSTSSIRGSRRQRGAAFGEGMAVGRKLAVAKPIGAGGPKLLGGGR